jgi:acyl-CoA thioesterase
LTGDRADRAAALLAADPFAGSVGVALGGVSDGSITVELQIDDRHCNFSGLTHGGVVFSLADCAFSLASNLANTSAVAIDAHLAFTAPSHPGDTLIARAEELTRGKTLATYRVVISRLGDGRVCGSFTGTAFIREA